MYLKISASEHARVRYQAPFEDYSVEDVFMFLYVCVQFKKKKKKATGNGRLALKALLSEVFLVPRGHHRVIKKPPPLCLVLRIAEQAPGQAGPESTGFHVVTPRHPSIHQHPRTSTMIRGCEVLSAANIRLFWYRGVPEVLTMLQLVSCFKHQRLKLRPGRGLVHY